MLTCSQAAHVGQDDILWPAVAQALPHFLRFVPGVEDLCVHSLLPDIDALTAASVCMQLLLHRALGQSQQEQQTAADPRLCTLVVYLQLWAFLIIFIVGTSVDERSNSEFERNYWRGCIKKLCVSQCSAV
jgi:hypothetical protein